MEYNVFKDYFMVMGITIGFFSLLCLVLYINFLTTNEIKKKLKRFWFLFRWWIIGKSHCNTSEKMKRFYTSLHKIFWGFIIVSTGLTLGMIYELFFL